MGMRRRCCANVRPCSVPGVAMRFSSEGKDYYKILGVSQSASPSEIKKAYRKRALETHPDQGGNKEDFAEVAEAYECLSNEDRRRVYDQYGSEAASNMNAGGNMGGFGGRTAEDIFAEFFKGGMGGFGGETRRGPPQVPPLEVTLNLTLEEVYKGVVKSPRVNRPTICSECRGFGTKSQKRKPKCAHCDGNGHVVQQHHFGPGMVQQTVTQCPRCNGSGTMAKADDQCSKCRGMGYRTVTQNVSIDVPAGVPPDVTLVVRGEGGTMPEAQPGDLHVHIQVASHETFKRRGNDLLVKKKITLSEALLGFHLTLKMLDGRSICVEAPKEAVLQPSSVLKVPNEGMPDAHGGRGDLYILTRLKLPRKLTEAQRNAIKQAFGDSKEGSTDTSGKTVTASVMNETVDELESTMASQWEAQQRGGFTQDGGSKRGKRRQQTAECVHQ
ncbi:DnaJ domain [Trypanosoma vivax]|nr:DnaJ domain [Trypanosoma vivax]